MCITSAKITFTSITTNNKAKATKVATHGSETHTA